MISLDPIFNNHSTEPFAETQHEVYERMSDFVDVLRDAPKNGLGQGLRIPQDFHVTPLSEGYTIYDWIGDSNVPREGTSLVLQLATNAPFLKNVPSEVEERAGSTEVLLDGSSSDALQASFLLDLPLLSLNHDRWAEPQIASDCEVLTDDGEIEQRGYEGKNIANLEHYEIHREWIGERRKRAIPDMEYLWKFRDELFPHLVFCESIETQLIHISPNSDSFQLIISRLSEMENYAANWSGGFDKDGFPTKCNASSQSTLEQYGRSHYTFTSPNGESVECGWHFYLPDARLYFAVGDKTFIVGHIGNHLPTVNFR